MVQIVVAPDIEAALVDYLPDVLADHGFTVPVATKPRGTGDSVTLYRTGGPAGTPISDWPQVTFDVRSASESRAAQLILLLRGIVSALPGQTAGGVFVYTVSQFAGPSNLPDPNYQGARYRWTCALHVKSSVTA